MEKIKDNKNKKVITTKYNNKSKLDIHAKLILNIILIALLFFGSIYMFIMANDIDVENEHILISYEENSDVSYTVSLKTNPYYQTSTLGMNQQYPSSLVDKINIKYKYNFKTNENGNYTYRYFTTATVVINNKNDKEKVDSNSLLLSRTYQLDNQLYTKEVNIKEYNLEKDYVIDYNYFNTFVNNYKNTYNLLVDSYLKVTMYVEVIDEHEGEKINKSKKMDINIPLASNPLSVNIVNPTDISDTIYNKTNTSTNSKLFIFLAVIMFLSSILLFIQEIKKVLKSDKEQSKYINKLNKIISANSEVIVKVKNQINLKNSNIIDVESIDELFDAQNELRIPIAYFEIKRNKEGCFVIVNGKEAWRYILKVEDEK